MYSLYRQLGLKRSLTAEAPSLALSLLIAELWFKFHSFTLECGAFLATWLAISYLFSRVARVFATRN